MTTAFARRGVRRAAGRPTQGSAGPFQGRLQRQGRRRRIASRKGGEAFQCLREPSGLGEASLDC